MEYTVVVHKSKQGYDVRCPALPGCHSQGETEKEALANIKDAIKAHLTMVRKETRGQRTRRVNIDQAYTAVVKQDGRWWIGWIEEVPGVNCQERTRTKLRQSLRATLSEALEMNRADARIAAGKGYEELSIAV